MNARSRVAVLVLIAASALAACGRGAQDNLSAGVRHHLQVLTNQIRSEVESGDRVRAQNSVAAFRRAVAGYERSDDISAAQAQRVVADANAIQRHLTLLPAPSTTPTTVAPPPPTAVPTQTHGKDHRKGHEKRNKHGDNGD